MAVLIESLTKTTDKSIVSIGEQLTFSFVFSSNQSATVQCTFTDDLAPCLEFVPGSVFFDGVNLANANPVTGFNFIHTRDFPAHRITFSAMAICRPDNGIVENSARVEYEFAGVPDITISNVVDIEITAAAACDRVSQQIVNVCLPVSVQPFATVGDIVTRCCGPATIIPGGEVCPGIPNGHCDFTITQRVCVEVPVEFGATVIPGEASVLCTGEGCTDANCPPADADGANETIITATPKECTCAKTVKRQ